MSQFINHIWIQVPAVNENYINFTLYCIFCFLFLVKHIIGHRNYCIRPYPYVPWRNLEVIESIEDELKEPPREVIPENPVKRIDVANPVN